jgi:predicted nuclease of predicted toxin-antitoxin system
LKGSRPVLRFFLDEGVPLSVGRALVNAGHQCIYLSESVAPGSPDQIVCAAAEANDAILVALDGDMKQIARQHGVSNKRFKTLSLLKLSCKEPQAASRVEQALTLIEHEWNFSTEKRARRLFVEIGDNFIRTTR